MVQPEVIGCSVPSASAYRLWIVVDVVYIRGPEVVHGPKGGPDG
jgi:hypothetical protein